MDIQVEEEMSGINVAPLVDVCLVLLLVFMVTSSYFSKQLMPVSVPAAVTSQSESQENVTISLSPTDGYALNEVPLSKAALATELRRHIKKSGITYVLIRADERTPHGEVDEILKMSKRAGAGRIAFATVPKA
jgi:biopolymer transport protein ExbD